MQLVRHRAILAIAATTLILLAPSAAEAASTRLLGPSGTLITGATARFTVQTPTSLRSLTVRLSGHDVSARFRRVAPRRYLGLLRWRGIVAPGLHSLEIMAVTKQGASSSAVRGYLFGGRSHGYGSVTGLGRRFFAPGGQITLRLHSMPALFSVRLNGREVSRSFQPVSVKGGTERIGRLAADDGLRFGRNQLQIIAADSRGAYVSVSRGLRVQAFLPLLSAGRDMRTVAGTRVTLAGSARSGVAGARLRYRWVLVRRPRHSHARLVRATGAKAVLRTDLPGHYAVRLTVAVPGRGGATASDVAMVAATPSVPPLGVPVSVGASGIRVGGTLYPFGSNAVIVLSLDRSTLEPTPGLTGYGTGVLTPLAVASYILTQGSSHIVVIAAKPGAPLNAFWSRAVNALGATVDAYGGSRNAGDDRLATGGWSAVGVGGTTSGGYLYVPTGGAQFNTGAALSGHLQFDASAAPQGYSFVKGDYSTFNTSTASTATTNTMQLGSATYTSSPLPAGCTGGLQLVILAARDLQGTYQQTVPTNCTNAALSQQGFQSLDSYLHNQPPEYSNQGRHLVFLQTIGSPWSSDDATLQARYQVGLDLSGFTTTTNSQTIQGLDFGGTAGVFNTATGGYALAGSDGLGEPGSLTSTGVEASSSLTNLGGSVSGLLRRNGQSDYEPVMGGIPSSTNPAGLGIGTRLPVIANQPTTPWPTDSLSDAPAILKYLATHVLGGAFATPPADASCYVPAVPDVRSEYCNLGLIQTSNWSTAVTTLLNLEEKAPAGFNAADWTTVTTELVKEMNIVSSVYNYVTTTQSWLSGNGNTAAIGQVVSQIDTALKPPPSPAGSPAGWWTDLSAAAFGVAQIGSDVLGGEGVTTLLSAFSGIGWLVADLIDGPGGEPQLATRISQSDVADLASQLTTRYAAMQAALGHFGDLIVTDYGKLQAFNRSGLANFDENDKDSFRLGVSLSTAKFAWTQLLPTVYNLDLTFNGAGPNPNTPPGADQFVCYAGTLTPETYRPFGPKAKNGPATSAMQYVVPIPRRTIGGGFPDTAQTYVIAGPGDPTNPAHQVFVPLPPQSMIANLFASPKGSVGNITQVGLFAPWFYERAFRQPRIVNCSP
jgi:hypothetical protein